MRMIQAARPVIESQNPQLAKPRPPSAGLLAIYDGAGIHGTSDDASIGSAASHGCIRMTIPDVIELYDRVNVGTPVYII